MLERKNKKNNKENNEKELNKTKAKNKTNINKKKEKEQNISNSELMKKLLRRSTFVIFSLLLLIFLLVFLKQIRQKGYFYKKAELPQDVRVIDVDKFTSNERELKDLKKFLEKK